MGGRARGGILYEPTDGFFEIRPWSAAVATAPAAPSPRPEAAIFRPEGHFFTKRRFTNLTAFWPKGHRESCSAPSARGRCAVAPHSRDTSPAVRCRARCLYLGPTVRPASHERVRLSLPFLSQGARLLSTCFPAHASQDGRIVGARWSDGDSSVSGIGSGLSGSSVTGVSGSVSGSSSSNSHRRRSTLQCAQRSRPCARLQCGFTQWR